MTLEDVERAKARHEDQLLSLDGVEGVGIGERDGRLAIKVYVDSSVLVDSSDIPPMLDGIPVVIEETGPFEAYQES